MSDDAHVFCLGCFKIKFQTKLNNISSDFKKLARHNSLCLIPPSDNNERKVPKRLEKKSARA